MKATILLGLGLLLFAPLAAAAATRLVPGQYPTIQQAIDNCNDGRIIGVENGVAIFGLVSEDSIFGGSVILHAAVTIEVISHDIEYYANFR